MIEWVLLLLWSVGGIYRFKELINKKEGITFRDSFSFVAILMIIMITLIQIANEL